MTFVVAGCMLAALPEAGISKPKTGETVIVMLIRAGIKSDLVHRPKDDAFVFAWL